ncbi:MAG: rRNA maturation RNase YbeY [Rhodospirillum sp.]|nr:rRNA maturation RNase YbeY [Rhodospirillum sp.]MCF8487975.1 rRNA maturation RNase YbeY [Rhodospirillum sp.]MCF8499322.1 rRNA maturation RNase YbeY [Rhodospirillum sp.]
MDTDNTAYPLTLLSRVEDANWSTNFSGGEEALLILVDRAVNAAVDGGDPSGLDIPGGTPLEISLVLSDDARVRMLNRDYRNKDKATNVLSFASLDAEEPLPAPGETLPLGDVILALETVRWEAEERDIPLEDHLFHLVVHGVLHLLGYDHEDEDEAREMESLETAILAAHGLEDPYDGALSDGEERERDMEHDGR